MACGPLSLHAGPALEDTSQQEVARAGEIDFFGYAGLNVDNVRAALPIHEGENFPIAELEHAKFNINELMRQNDQGRALVAAVEQAIH